MVDSIIPWAALNDPPGGRLKETVAETRPPRWLTWIAVWLLTELARAATGTIVSEAVLSALAVDAPPRLFEIELVFAFVSAAIAIEVSELVAEAVVEVVTGRNVVRPATVPGVICVCAVPVALPAAVLKKIRA